MQGKNRWYLTDYYFDFVALSTCGNLYGSFGKNQKDTTLLCARCQSRYGRRWKNKNRDFYNRRAYIVRQRKPRARALAYTNRRKTPTLHDYVIPFRIPKRIRVPIDNGSDVAREKWRLQPRDFFPFFFNRLPSPSPTCRYGCFIRPANPPPPNQPVTL